MIHLDTGFLDQRVRRGSAEDRRLREWLAQRRPIGISAVGWAEFLCGPVDVNDVGHPSTWVLPCTTRLSGESLLRVPLPRGIAGNREHCEVMIDQSRSIDNRRFVRALRDLPPPLLREVEDKLRRLANL